MTRVWRRCGLAGAVALPVLLWPVLASSDAASDAASANAAYAQLVAAYSKLLAAQNASKARLTQAQQSQPYLTLPPQPPQPPAPVTPPPEPVPVVVAPQPDLLTQVLAALQPVLTALLVAIGGVLTVLVRAYVPRIIAVFEQATSIKLTEQQRAAIYAAAETAKGIIQTKLDQGIIQVAHVTTDNAVVMEQARAALTRVPGAAAAQNVTPEQMAAIVVGRVDTTPKTSPLVVSAVKVAGA